MWGLALTTLLKITLQCHAIRLRRSLSNYWVIKNTTWLHQWYGRGNWVRCQTGPGWVLAYSVWTSTGLFLYERPPVFGCQRWGVRMSDIWQTAFQCHSAWGHRLSAPPRHTKEHLKKGTFLGFRICPTARDLRCLSSSFTALWLGETCFFQIVLNIPLAEQFHLRLRRACQGITKDKGLNYHITYRLPRCTRRGNVNRS